MPRIVDRLWSHFVPAIAAAVVACGAVADEAMEPAEQVAREAVAESDDSGDGEPMADDVDEPEPPLGEARDSRVVYPQVNIGAFARRYRSFAVDGGAESDALGAIEQALAGHTDDRWDFVETPLRDVVRHVQVSLGVPVAIDVVALEEAGFDLDTPVTFGGQGERVAPALHRMLEPLGLAITIADEAVLVTSMEAAHERLVPRMYPVPCGLGAADADALVDLVQSTVDVDTWETVGGFAVIRFLGPPGSPLMVITQTLAGHDRVESLLATIHDRGLAEYAAADGGTAAPVARIHRVSDATARAELAATLVELCNRSLGVGGDPAATVTDVGGSLVVQSAAPEFQALAGQMIAAVAGVRVESRPAALLQPEGADPF